MNFYLKLLIMIFLGSVHVLGALAIEGDWKKGKALFVKHCAVCHGPDGKRDGYALFDPPVADLTSPEIQKKSDLELWRSVHDGLPNTAMGTWKWVLSAEETAHVLAYMRSLAR